MPVDSHALGQFPGPSRQQPEPTCVPLFELTSLLLMPSLKALPPLPSPTHPELSPDSVLSPFFLPFFPRSLHPFLLYSLSLLVASMITSQGK